ncbi:AraC family transcriptional regulator [Paenibacillaceae bacterium]|nr:AraC family transcriptional regulator [Paenibacillaceae bacterium]
MLYSLSRLSNLDVKWAGVLDTNIIPSFYSRSHYNPYYQFIVAAEGKVRLQVEGKKTTLQAGDSLLLCPWEQHEGWQADENGGTFFWVQFSCDPGMNEFALDRATELNIVHVERTELRTVVHNHNDLLILPRQFQNRQRYPMLVLFEQLIAAMNKPVGYFRYRATLLLSELLRLLAEDFLEQSQLSTSVPASYITFRKLVDHLNNYYERDVSGEGLEQRMERKYSYLCQVFKKYSGTSINHYVQQLRLQRAEYLLLGTSRSIKDIAQEVGYSDPFYFSRLFKKNYGIAPQQYRGDSQTK